MLAASTAALGYQPTLGLVRRPLSTAASRSVLAMSADSMVGAPWAADVLAPLQQLPTMLVADIDVVGTIATGLVILLVLFIGSVAAQALAEVASQAPDRAERIREQTSSGGGGDGPDFLYDDSGTGANNKKPEKGLLKKSKQFKADGTKYAPWQSIDEDRLAQMKKDRARQNRN